MNPTQKVLSKLRNVPLGLKAFSKMVSFKAPYFRTISPEFTRLEPGFGEATLRKRWSVQNHIGTVHAIACANLCEFVGGVTLECSIPDSHRWIPKSMKINYLKKAGTDLVARTRFPTDQWPDSGSFITHVDVYDTKGELVVDADIEMHVSLKKKS